MNRQSAVKRVSDNRVGGYLVVWGNPGQKDLQGEYFTPDTDLALDWYAQRPALYHHGTDKHIKSSVIGVIDTLKVDDTGLWAEAQLNMRHSYVEKVLELVERGVLNWSSGSVPHLVEVDADGRIKRWPIVEGSLTPTPAEPRLTDIRALKSIEGFGAMIDLKELATRSVKEGTTRTRRDGQPNPLTITGGKLVNLRDIIKVIVDAMDVEPLTDDQLDQLAAQAESQLKGDDDDDHTRADDDDDYTRADDDDDHHMRADDDDYTRADDDDDHTRADDEDDYASKRNASKRRRRPAKRAKSAPASLVNDRAFVKSVLDAINDLREDNLRAQAAQTVAHVAAGQGGSSRVSGRSAQKSSGIAMRTKYERAGLNAEDMSYLYHVHGMVAAQSGRTYDPGEAFFRELATKAERAAREEQITLSDSAAYAIKAIRSDAIKANEVSHTTQSNFGEDWVPTLWLDQLWLRERISNPVAKNLTSIDMPSDPYELPVEGVDPDVYFVSETTDVAQLTDTANNPFPMDKVGTAKRTISTGKLGVRVSISAELEEDAIIPVVPEQRRQVLQAMEDAIDFVLLSGDNATVGNINQFDGTPAANAKFMYGSLGLMTLPLRLNTDLAVDAGGAPPTLAMLRQMRYRLARPYRTRRAQMMYIVDPEVEGVLLNIPEMKDYFYRGTPGSVITGEVAKIDGIPVYVSDEIKPSAANGLVSETDSNNTRGRALLVYKPMWRYGYRRNTRVTVSFRQEYDAWLLMASARMGQIRQDDECSSVLYNIAV